MCEVAFGVAGERVWRAEADDTAFVIEIYGEDWNVHGLGDVVEAGLPVFRFFARSFWRHDEHELVLSSEELRHLGDDIVGGTAIDGDTAEPAHEGAERAPEDGLLHHEAVAPACKDPGGDSGEKA